MIRTQSAKYSNFWPGRRILLESQPFIRSNPRAIKDDRKTRTHRSSIFEHKLLPTRTVNFRFSKQDVMGSSSATQCPYCARQQHPSTFKTPTDPAIFSHYRYFWLFLLSGELNPNCISGIVTDEPAKPIPINHPHYA